VSLSAAEAALLQSLLKRPNKILTREQLIGERELDPFDRSIDVRISRLRRKLEDDPQDPKIIKTGTAPATCCAPVSGSRMREVRPAALRGPGKIRVLQRGATNMTRPFKILGVQQIAIGGPSKDRLRTLWVDMFGLEVTGNFKSERENVDEDITAMGKGPFKVEVDLMQPLDPEKKPAVHTTPLNHVGLWMDDLPKCVEWLTANGVRFAPGGIRKGAAGFDITFLHPKGNEEFPIGGEGVLIELVQAPPEVSRPSPSWPADRQRQSAVASPAPQIHQALSARRAAGILLAGQALPPARAITARRAWKVLQAASWPDSMPRLNQRMRCSAEPWVKLSGTA
jgi:lactoylglutathione lyase